MDSRTTLHLIHSTHLDLYWIGEQSVCLEKGASIIDDALLLTEKDPSFHFFIESVRFLQYYVYKYPEHIELLKKNIDSGNVEISCCYTDREENTHDGEAMVRNAVYGKRLIRRLLERNTRVAHHPDLPGLAEQTPQIYSKCGVRYYLFSRGYQYGKRFRWRSPDGSEMIGCNFPIHYSYYNMDREVIPHLDQIREEAHSDNHLLLSCSAGDLGPLNTFMSKEGDGFVRRELLELVRQWNQNYPELHFQLDNSVRVLDSLPEEQLEILEGESPSKWGAHGTSSNVVLFQMDRRATDALCEAEYYYSLCMMQNLKVACDFQQNPIAHQGGSGGERRYFDLKETPEGIPEWLDYGWQLLLVTQDHNFGGIEGAQSWFDRYIYLKAALEIAENVKSSSVKALADEAQGDVTILNPLNWTRDEMISLPGDGEFGNIRFLQDACGIRYPALYTADGWKAYVKGIPACGCLPLQWCGKAEENVVSNPRTLYEDEDRIYLSNAYYALVLNRKTGVLESIRDRKNGRDLSLAENFLSLDIYQDDSNSVNERELHPALEDSSRLHVRHVGVVEDNPFYTKLKVETEILNARMSIVIMVSHVRNEIRVIPEIRWYGALHLQARLHLGMGDKTDRIYYATPDAIAEKGKTMSELKIYAPDEVCDEIYERYREVRGWYAIEGNTGGISVATDAGCFDFAGTAVDAILFKNVYSCGDLDYVPANEGTLRWEFVIRSYTGTWEEAETWRENWELRRPVMAVQSKGNPSKPKVFLKGLTGGRIETLKPACDMPQKFILRMIGSKAKTEILSPVLPEGWQIEGEGNLLEEKQTDLLNPLKPWEIKTVLISSNGQ